MNSVCLISAVAAVNLILVFARLMYFESKLSIAELKPVPRILKNLLARCDIRCDNEEFGCEVVVKLDILAMHLKVTLLQSDPLNSLDFFVLLCAIKIDVFKQ